MKKVILTLALVFSAGLFANTALALTSNSESITVVKGDKDKKKKKKKKKSSCCAKSTGEKKSCSAAKTAEAEK